MMASANDSDALLERVDRLRRRLTGLRTDASAERPIPEWALLPLRLAGMSAAEIEQLRCSTTAAPPRPSGAIDAEIRALERDIAALEDATSCRRGAELDDLAGLLDVALRQARGLALADGQRIFYDSGEARLERLLEGAVSELAMLRRERRDDG